jgi:AhpD family alkylhydroperoxidase
MKERMDYRKASPQGAKAIADLHTFLHGCGLDQALLELVKLRASQINGCAYCIDMHTKKMRAAGESEQRIYLLSAWEEAPLYTPRERAALAWTEAVTLISQSHAPDAVYDEVRKHFNDQELADLTLAICAINSANRMSIAFRRMPADDRTKAGRAAE